jgi:hypothetical protein
MREKRVRREGSLTCCSGPQVHFMRYLEHLPPTLNFWWLKNCQEQMFVLSLSNAFQVKFSKWMKAREQLVCLTVSLNGRFLLRRDQNDDDPGHSPVLCPSFIGEMAPGLHWWSVCGGGGGSMVCDDTSALLSLCCAMKCAHVDIESVALRRLFVTSNFLSTKLTACYSIPSSGT